MNLQILPAETIYISPDRQRTEIPEDHVKSLAADILENGLIHALTLDKDTNLVAGCCRLTAIKYLDKPYMYAGEQIAAGFVPCVITDKVDEESLFRVELSENIYRKDLSPMDQAKAFHRLHEFLQAKNPDTHTNQDTAQEIAKIEGHVRKPSTIAPEVADSIFLSGFQDDEDVKAAKTTKEAVKIARKKLENSLTAALGASLIQSSSDYTIQQGDCREVLPTFADGTYNGILCDPPYGMDADTFGEQTSAEGHEYADDKGSALSIAEAILQHGFRVTKSDAHLYMFSDIRAWPELCALARKHGWLPFATPLIWHKPGFGHAPQPGMFSRRYECILFCTKGNRKLHKVSSDVISYPGVKDKVHAAQKPTELLAHLLTLSFFPGELVLDPCTGSGSIFRAAHMARMRAVGIEQSPKYVNISKAIINELK
jgi:DNA modification methylase